MPSGASPTKPLTRKSNLSPQPNKYLSASDKPTDLMTLRKPLLFLAISILPFSGQKAMGAEKGITLRLIACEVSAELPKVFLETKDSKSDVLDLPSSALSAPMSVSARSVDVKAADNDVPLCSITLPDEGKSFAVLLAPEGEAGFAPFLVKLDGDSFKPGDFSFINTSSKTMVLKLGGTELTVGAGEVAISRPTEPVNDRYYMVTMSARDDSGDKTIASTRWPLQNKGRGYIMFLESSNGKITYRAINE
jgi:hypothetical protein